MKEKELAMPDRIFEKYKNYLETKIYDADLTELIRIKNELEEMVLEISSRKNCKVFKFEVEIAKIVEKQMKKFENNNFKNPSEKIGEVICSKGIQNYKEAVYLICKIENFLTEIISDTVTIFG